MPPPVLIRPPPVTPPVRLSAPAVTLAVSVFALSMMTPPVSVSLLTAVCSSVPESLTSSALLKVVPPPPGVPRRSFAAAPSRRTGCKSDEMGLAVPPPPSTETVPLTTRSSAPSRSLKIPSRISSPVPPFLTNWTPVKPPSPSSPSRKFALPAMTRLCPLAPARIVTAETSVRGVASTLLMVSSVGGAKSTPRLRLKIESSKTVEPAPLSVTTVPASTVTSLPPSAGVRFCGLPFHRTSPASTRPASTTEAMETASAVRGAAGRRKRLAKVILRKLNRRP